MNWATPSAAMVAARIELWVYGSGRIPSKQSDVAALARVIVEMGKLDREWLPAFWRVPAIPTAQS